MSDSTNLTHNPDLPARPCPGLDGIYCGQPRKLPAGYCDEHRRQYQRRRYSDTRKKAGGTYAERIITRTPQDLCDCCNTPAPGDLSALTGSGNKLICGQCHRFAQDIISAFGYGRFKRLVEFATEHPMAFLPRTSTVTQNEANPTAPKPGHAQALLFQTGKKVTEEQAFEYEYVKAVWARAKAYGFDIDADDTYEFIETNWGAELRKKLEAAIVDGTLVLKTELTEDEAPWLF